MEVKNIEAAILELLNEALALDPASLKVIMVTGSLPSRSLIAHRQAGSITQPDKFGTPMVNALSIINATLHKLGSINEVFPLMDPHGHKVHTFALRVRTETKAYPDGTKATGPAPLPVASPVVPVAPAQPATAPATDQAVAPKPAATSLDLDWVESKSSNIRRIQYLGSTRELKVQFKTGRTYIYAEVPLETYQGLLEAQSQGKYLNGTIKPRHEVREVPS